VEEGGVMAFKDRFDAARQLAERLSQYRGENPLILGIPRGAVPMAAEIAQALEGEVDVILVHKLGAPGQPELAIGSIDETGAVYLADHASAMDIPSSYLEQEKAAQLKLLRERRRLYTESRPARDPRGRIVIIVDDGIATGSTMIAALRSVRRQSPQKVIVATAVAPPDTIRKLRHEADDVVCLHTPDWFLAVGDFFEDFTPVTDEEVVKVLQQAHHSQEERP